jgi:hypothetical protein
MYGLAGNLGNEHYSLPPGRPPRRRQVLKFRAVQKTRAGVPRRTMLSDLLDDEGLLDKDLSDGEPKLAWLQERLSLGDKSLSKLVQSKPHVLGCSIEDNFGPKLAWHQGRLDVDDKSLSKLVQKLPSVLGCSLEENLQPKLALHGYKSGFLCMGRVLPS